MRAKFILTFISFLFYYLHGTFDIKPVFAKEYDPNQYEVTKGNEHWIDVVTLIREYGFVKQKWVKLHHEVGDLYEKEEKIKEDLRKERQFINETIKEEARKIRLALNMRSGDSTNRQNELIYQSSIINFFPTYELKFSPPQFLLNDRHILTLVPSTHKLMDKHLWRSIFKHLQKWRMFDAWLIEIDASRLHNHLSSALKKGGENFPDMVAPFVLNNDGRPLVLMDLSKGHGDVGWNTDTRERTMVSAINALMKKMTQTDLEKDLNIGALIGSGHQVSIAKYLTEDFNFNKPFEMRKDREDQEGEIVSVDVPQWYIDQLNWVENLDFLKD